MSRYFTTKRWIELLRGLPPHGALLHSSALQTLSGLDERAAKQAAWRLGRAGLLTHLGGGWYTHVFAKLSIEEAAAALVCPSYVSLETILLRSFVTTQSSVDLTCITTQPTQQRQTPLGEITYRAIAPSLYWGFDIKTSANGLYVFEAWPEKALLDLVYLSRRQGEPIWIDLDFSRLDERRLAACARKFPASVQREVESLRQTHQAVA